MSLVLTKAAGPVTLKGATGKFPSRLLIAVGWEEPPRSPTSHDKLLPDGSDPNDHDVDLTLVARDRDGKAIETAVCYWGQMDLGWAVHTADKRGGAGAIEGTDDDEQVNLPDLKAIPVEIASLDVIVTIDKTLEAKTNDGTPAQKIKAPQTFGDLNFAFARIEDPDRNIEPIRIELTRDELFADEGMIFVKLRRRGPTWTVENAVAGGPKWKDLQAAIYDTVNP